MTTALLLHLDGTDGSTTITDDSGTGKTVTAYGNAQLDTAGTMLAGSTAWLDLDGTNSYVQTGTHSDFNVSGDWTIEGWIRVSSTADGGIFYLGDLTSDTNRVALYLLADGSLNLYLNQGGSWWGPLVTSTGVVVFNYLPKHIAVCKKGSVYSIFYNGVRRNSYTMFSTSANIGKLAAGVVRNPAGSLSYLHGQLDEIRFDKSVALYDGSTYTVPTPPLTSLGIAALEGDAVAEASASAFFVGQAPLAADAEAVATASGNLSHGVPLAGAASGVAAASGTLTDSLVIPMALTVSYPSGSIDIPMILSVSESGSIDIPMSLAVWDGAAAAGDSVLWTVDCSIDGTDVSDTVHGVPRVRAAEGAARIAELVILPPVGSFAPLDYVGKPITIDYVLQIAGAEVPFRMFTGRIDTPAYDLNSGLLSLLCVDDLQNRVAALARDVIDGLVEGRYSAAVQGEILDNWDYAKARLATVAASLDAGASGGIRVTPWELSDVWATYTDAELLDATSAMTLPQRSTLINRVAIEFEYRYPRLRQRFAWTGWSGPQNDMKRSGYRYPMQQDVLGAVNGSGWQAVTAVFWPAPAAIPHSSGGFIYPVEGSIDMAIISLTQRHSQTVTEAYAIDVTAPESVTANGELERSIRGALEETFDGQAWESALDIAPLMASGGEQDWAPNATREDSDYAIQTLLDIANVMILGSHRGARVTNSIPCNPLLDLDKRVAISTADMDAEGKVVEVVHTLDIESGKAITEFSIACFGAGGAGIITPDTLDPPAAPAEAEATQDWSADVPALTVNTFGGTPYSDNLMGLLLNPPETITVEDIPDVGTQVLENPWYVAGSYPVTGFRVRMPGVDDADRNPIEIASSAAYQVVIAPDPFTFTRL